MFCCLCECVCFFFNPHKNEKTYLDSGRLDLVAVRVEAGSFFHIHGESGVRLSQGVIQILQSTLWISNLGALLVSPGASIRFTDSNVIGDAGQTGAFIIYEGEEYACKKKRRFCSIWFQELLSCLVSVKAVSLAGFAWI